MLAWAAWWRTRWTPRPGSRKRPPWLTEERQQWVRKEEAGQQEVLAMSGDSDSDLELPTARELRRQEKGVEEVKEV